MNDQVLVRDVTSGAFAPRYTPHFRVVAVHGPNRIVVRDEKGNESVRRASHLKHCDSRTKFSSMVPENKEYEQFGRSTKLLLHSKDVPEVHFPEETNTAQGPEAVEQIVVNSVIESVSGCPENAVETREISPQPYVDDNNDDDQCEKCECATGNKKTSEISLVEQDKTPSFPAINAPNGAWLPFSMRSMCKWSNAFKEGFFNTREGQERIMTTYPVKESENSQFSFFL